MLTNFKKFKQQFNLSFQFTPDTNLRNKLLGRPSKGDNLNYIDRIELPNPIVESPEDSYGYTMVRLENRNLFKESNIEFGNISLFDGNIHEQSPVHKNTNFRCYAYYNGMLHWLSPFTNQFVRVGKPKLRIRLLKKLNNNRCKLD